MAGSQCVYVVVIRAENTAFNSTTTYTLQQKNILNNSSPLIKSRIINSYSGPGLLFLRISQ